MYFVFADDVITLSDRTMIQSNGGVSKSTNDFIDDLSDDDIELIVVKPKSKSRVPRPLSSTSYENHDGIEFIAQQSGFETQMALTPKLGYIKVHWGLAIGPGPWLDNGYGYLIQYLAVLAGWWVRNR